MKDKTLVELAEGSYSMHTILMAHMITKRFEKLDARMDQLRIDQLYLGQMLKDLLDRSSSADV